jgi:hypothetical protein
LSGNFPIKLQDAQRLGLRLASRRPWYFGTRRLPFVLFLYDDQRWARFYFVDFVAFHELHMRSGEYQRDIGAQKADAP